jgi:uncharacterized membrane protein
MSEWVQKLAFSILGSYILSLIAVLVPYYNKVYRLVVGLAHATLLLISLCLIVLVLVPGFSCKRHARKALFVAVLGLLVLFVESKICDWRYSITDRYIKDNCCDTNGPANDERILGGIVTIQPVRDQGGVSVGLVGRKGCPR